MKLKTSALRVTARLSALLLICPLLLAGCIGPDSQDFLLSAGDILSSPYFNVSYSASYNRPYGAEDGGLMPEKYVLSAEGTVAGNMSKYDLTFYIKQPDTANEPLLRIWGSGGDMYLRALSYPFLLPELLLYKDYINEFEYARLLEALESGTALKADALDILSRLTDGNEAAMFLATLVEGCPSLDLSGLYSSLADVAADSVDNLSYGLSLVSYGTGWVRYKADGASLTSALTDALAQASDSALEVSGSMDAFLRDNRPAFADSFRSEYNAAKTVGGLVPDFSVFEDERFEALLQDAANSANGLSALSRTLSERLADRQSEANEAGIKSTSEITLSGAPDKVWLRVVTGSKKDGEFSSSSDIKLTLTRGDGFALHSSPQYTDLDGILWEAAKDYYKSEEHKAMFLYLDYNSMTAKVTTVSQEVREYSIEGITEEYFRSATLDGKTEPKDAVIVPARLACEIFGEDVMWDASAGKAYVERRSGEGVVKVFLTGRLCGGKLFVPVTELYRLDIVCFTDSIYGLELAK